MFLVGNLILDKKLMKKHKNFKNIGISGKNTAKKFATFSEERKIYL